jgi:two-component system response regulator YesN
MYRLIFVDDEPWALSGMEDIVDWKEYGFEICRSCTSAKEALEAIEACKPDAVFTDIRMPDMSGIDLVKRAKQDGLSFEFVIISAYSDFEVARKAITYGAFSYLLKPLNIKEVKEVASLLHQKLAAREELSEQVVDLQSEELLDCKDKKKFLQDAACYAGCYLMIDRAPVSAQLRTETGTLQITPIRLFQFDGKAYLISTNRHGHPIFGKACGWSRRYRDFSALSDMLEEAQASLDGGFDYVEHETVSSIQAYLGQCYAQEITLKELTVRFFLSETYLCDLFKKYTGETITNFLKRIRIHHACEILKSTDLPLKQIAEQVGYMDYSYFGRMFKNVTGLTPDLYRRENGA